MIKLTCNDGCGEEFVLIQHGTEKLHDDVERVGFSCPNCGKVYTAYYSNRKIKELNHKLSNLMKKPKGQKITSGFLAFRQEEIRKTKKELKDEVERLKKEIETG